MKAILRLSLIFLTSQLTTYAAFVHSGVLISKEQLDFMKAQVAAKKEPFLTAFNNAKGSIWGSLSYDVRGPPSTIECGSYSNPNIGCTEENHDSTAALTQALLWYISGDKTYANNAITIMNQYATKLTGGFLNSNGPLQASWGGQKWPAAAEIIYYSNAGWPAAEFTAFKNMLVKHYIPVMQGRDLSTINGNWALTIISASMGIAVLADDQKLFDKTVKDLRSAIPAYFYYFPEDGATPKTSPLVSPNWNGQTVFSAVSSGITQETCRDMQHAEFGIGGAFNALEIAYIQGVDLYTEFTGRLTATMEFNTGLFPVGFTSLVAAGKKVTIDNKEICGGAIKATVNPTFEIGYNHYANRKGISLPKTKTFIEKSVRAVSFKGGESALNHVPVFETLHHGDEYSLYASPSTTTKASSSTTSRTVPTTITSKVSVAPTSSIGVPESSRPSSVTEAPIITIAPTVSTDVDQQASGSNTIQEKSQVSTFNPVILGSVVGVIALVAIVAAVVVVRRRSTHKQRKFPFVTVKTIHKVPASGKEIEIRNVVQTSKVNPKLDFGDKPTLKLKEKCATPVTPAEGHDENDSRTI